MYKSPVTERLKYLRTLTRLNRTQLTEKHNFSESTLRLYENGNIPITEKGIHRCIELYSKEGIIVNEAWLKYGTGMPPLVPDTQDNIPLNIQNEINAALSFEEKRLLNEEKILKKLYSDLCTLYISNDDMMPIYKIGDLIGGNFYDNPEDFLDFHNMDCIAMLQSGNIIFRRFMIAENKKYRLTSLNINSNSSEPIIYNANIIKLAPIMFHHFKLDRNKFIWKHQKT